MDNLIIFVEGENDELFFEKIILKLFSLKKEYNQKEDKIKIVKYQQKGKKKFLQYLNFINKYNINYIFISDFDSRKCITSRKQEKIKKYYREGYDKLESDNIFIVKNEIESWFLAGVDNKQKIFRNINVPKDTEKTSKNYLEQFLKKTQFNSRVDFFIEVSEHYNYGLAMQRNESFRYFLEKLELNEIISFTIV